MTKQVKIIIVIFIIAVLGAAGFVIYKNNIVPINLFSKSAEEIQKPFAENYPKYAETVAVKIEKETQDRARGTVVFKAGMPGEIFLAAKIDGKWKIIFDGNGQISCGLSKFGFPNDMLEDCK